MPEDELLPDDMWASADRPLIIQAAQGMVAEISHGNDQAALDLLTDLRPVELQFVAWTLAKLVNVFGKSVGMTAEQLGGLLGDALDQAIRDDVHRGLGNLERDDDA